MFQNVDWANLQNPHLFINGDCMEYMKTMPDKYVDLCICDPPYGLGDKILTSGGTWAGKYKPGDAKWDVAPGEEYFQELFRVSRNQIIWGGNYFNLPPTRGFVIWDKISHLPTMADCEYAWTSFDKNAKICPCHRTNILGEERIHICQKPVALYEWLLTNYAKKGDKILDTHVGSGSSLIACYRLGFDFIGFEIDEEYYKKAKERLEREKAQVRFSFG